MSKSGPLDDNESNPTILWAEIWRLRSMIKGPEGFETWRDAAMDEKIKRAQAETDLAKARETAAYNFELYKTLLRKTIGEDPNLKQFPEPPIVKEKVWECKLDGLYDCYVERESPYTGTLKVSSQNGSELLHTTVRLSYGALFGPDASDVVQWMDMCVEAVDNQVKPGASNEDAEPSKGSSS